MRTIYVLTDDNRRPLGYQFTSWADAKAEAARLVEECSYSSVWIEEWQEEDWT